MHQPMQGAHAQRVREDAVGDGILPDDLSGGEIAILRRLEMKPIDLRWGRGGWTADSLPRPAKRADFDRICKRIPALVEVRRAQLVLASDTN